MRYYKINKYILSIELLDDSIHNENRNNIIDKYLAKYETNKFKIIQIENMINNQIICELYSYKIGDIIIKEIIYFFSKERAFFELDYDYYTESYEPIDKLYYINFYKEYNMIYSGIHKSWYESGQLKEEFYHINGLLEGKYRHYDENNQLQIEYNFIGDKLF